MNHVDELIQTCVATPDDDSARRVLSDALRAIEEFSLANAVEAKTTGRRLIDQLAALSARLTLPPTLHLLWAVFELLPRLGSQQQTPQQLLLPYFDQLPADVGPVERDRPPVNRPWRTDDRPWRVNDQTYGGTYAPNYGDWTVQGAPYPETGGTFWNAWTDNTRDDGHKAT